MNRHARSRSERVREGMRNVPAGSSDVDREQPFPVVGAGSLACLGARHVCDPHRHLVRLDGISDSTEVALVGGGL